ncbi:holo-[acyl-carrier protein] synthase [Thermotomaculum hydrothermale]|uniref:Holo-[acyl-carrier-protein] synthase n=1 Tax=Thermotomaculum hydrothermale TaxID=981385 RepID=A0A7R6PIE4_9BACT|nr:holo-ACP synthase [Thermotomaculum hydrothermale]BBB33174.1 holo-[acyl-carrier protein] synthase [Thermotomaculum hydrothermale]
MDIEIGTDIVSIKRIEKSFNKFGDKFVKRILTEREIREYSKRKDRLQFIASRFAAKEAVYKAYNLSPFSWHRIEILKNGEIPVIYIDGKEKENIKISLSHEKEYVVAFCVRIK